MGRDSAVSLREEAGIRDAWLEERLETVLPSILERIGIDCWVLVAREYNEDPIVRTMLPATWITARRRTILVFTDFGRERVAIARYAVGNAFPAAWDPGDEPDQWARLSAYLEDKAPQRIALNRSPLYAVADGLSASEHDRLITALSPDLRSRVVATHEPAVGWLETRSASEKHNYSDICARAHDLLRTALSSDVVTPGTTSTADVEWWLRQSVLASGYRTWFQPSVSVQRPRRHRNGDFSEHPGDTIIEPGDLIHIDFGIEYLGLHTDQQQHAYVLRNGEDEAPLGLRAGLAGANRLQDILIERFRPGATGNDVLSEARRQALAEGLQPCIYSHPIGLHGHGAGPTIGLWDQQDGIPGTGDYPIHADTAYSIELSVVHEVPEWDGQEVRFMLEEEALFSDGELEFIDGRQTEFWLI
ncbi:MAG: M24 family metallopeptidase [Acidimicrobiia bacterium]|nr:M24 family metallopeptidase [Acidimicrobiia bacterium]